jgi:hypothetical protein
MTPRERAKEATYRVIRELDAGNGIHVRYVEEAIIAAVEEDRKTRPHEFVGRSDRWCEVCNEPDRDNRHLFSREYLRNSIEAEREACAKMVEELSIGLADYPPDVQENIAALIRARSSASSTPQAD